MAGGGALDGPVREVGQLALVNDRLRRQLIVGGRMSRGVAAARSVQAAAMPGTVPRPAGIRIAAVAEPAEETGGDVYDVMTVPATHGAWRAGDVFLLLADATGHGFGPAIISMQLRAMLRMAVAAGLDLETMVHAADRQLAEELPGAHYVTAWVARYDPRTFSLEWISAGQGPLLHHDAARGVTGLLAADRPPLGIGWRGDFQPRRTVIEPGDVLVALSDGYHETPNVRGEPFGIDALRDRIDAWAHVGSAGLLERLRRAVDRHAAGRGAMDDRTAVVITGDRGDDVEHEHTR
jgi:phosphoserine phosphatase